MSSSKAKTKPDSAESDKKENEPDQSFLSHLAELRDRLMRSVLVIAVFFIAMFSFSNEIYEFFSATQKERCRDKN